MTSIRTLLQQRPLLTSVVYTVVGVLPLYLTAAQSVRLQQELMFNRTQLGLIVGAFYLVSAIASRRVGPLLDRRGPYVGLRLSGVGTTVAALVATTGSSGWVVLAIAMGLAGLANALGQIASNVVVAKAVVGHRRGIGFASKQAAVPIGAMFAGLAIPWIGPTVSWRIPYLVTAALGLIMMAIAPHFESIATVRNATHQRINGALAAFMLTAAIGGGVGNSLASFVTDASVTRGFSEAAGARMLTIGSIVAIAVRIAVGLVADRRQRSGLTELVILLGVAVVGLGILGVSGDSETLYVVGVLSAFAGSWGWQGVMFFTVVNIIRMPAATATGAVAAGAYLGTTVLPPLIGTAADAWSYEAVFAIAAAAMVVAIAAVILSNHLAERDAQSERAEA